jgi:sec-independent protein translocase protein TatA
MRLGIWEIVLILVLVLVLFGGGKLAGVGKALGKSIKDFKNEMKSDDDGAKAEVKDNDKAE